MLGKSCEGCGKPASLKCPTCTKLNLDASFFCDQACFKQNWAKHRIKHQTMQPAIYDPFPTFPYTGSLRPRYPLSATRILPASIARPDYAEDGRPKSEIQLKGSHKIECLSVEEIEKMRKVCKIGREVLEEGQKAAKVGVTTDEIDRVVHEACIERDAYPSPLNYYGFPKSCCTSVNEVICHGIPDKYELKDGDILNIDISVMHDGFHGDLNETILIGNVNEQGQRLVKTTKECLDKAIELGMRLDLGNVIQKHASANGFSVVRTYCGHGIHRHFHCAPNVPHYSKNKAVGVMKAGHTFTIEPMISEGNWKDVTWPDGWTACTADGKRSAQFEHTLLVTDSGVEILT